MNVKFYTSLIRKPFKCNKGHSFSLKNSIFCSHLQYVSLVNTNIDASDDIMDLLSNDIIEGTRHNHIFLDPMWAKASALFFSS